MSKEFKDIINSIRVVNDGQDYKIAFEMPKSIILTNQQLQLLSDQWTAAIDEANYLAEELKRKNGGAI